MGRVVMDVSMGALFFFNSCWSSRIFLAREVEVKDAPTLNSWEISAPLPRHENLHTICTEGWGPDEQ